MDPFKTVPEIIRFVESQYTNPKALNDLQKGHWVNVSTQSLVREVKQVALGLVALGVKKGDPVGIVANPSAHWTIVDLAIMVAGGVCVPLFANLSEENFIFEVAQTSLKTIFVGGQEQWNMLQNHKKFFENVIRLDGPSSERTIGYQDLLKKGEQLNTQQPDLYATLEQSVTADDLATIVYTSGSTGVPKGVELTHGNVTGILHLDTFKLRETTDRYLSILPLAHIFGRALNMNMIVWGVGVYYFNDLKNLPAACREVEPTLIVVVPRLLEKMYDRMHSTIHNASFIKRLIGMWAFKLANKSKKMPWDNFFAKLADRLVYAKMRQALGGKTRVVISGGAHLNPHLAHFFINIGIPLFEGWGMTEASTITVNLPGKRKVGTVGLPFPTMVLKIAPNGEILVKGPIVMRGYYRNRQATQVALDEEGWLHTGDKGTIDADGFVTIEGRIKEIFKTSTGEYIIPVPIEQTLCKSPIIDMAMVIGEGQKFASCLLFPNFEALHNLKAAYRRNDLSDEEFLESDVVKKMMRDILDKMNPHLNHWEQIHEYRFIPIPLSIETGELTPSMKLRREVIMEKFRPLIESIYPSQEEV